MSFLEILKNGKDKESFEQPQGSICESEITVEAKEKKPEEILRGAGYKIRLVTPTSFGTQIDFAKKYDEKEIEDLLKDFTIKIKGKSAFIVD
jgi:hypothetical protein